MAIFANQYERKIKKLIKDYTKLYEKLFKVEQLHDEVVDELKNVANSQLQILLTDLEMNCIAIDNLMAEFSEKDPELYKKFFNTIPKFSRFDQGEDFVSDESKMYVLPKQTYSAKKLKALKRSLDNIQSYQDAFFNKKRYGDFVGKKTDIPEITYSEMDPIKEALEKASYPKKLKTLMLRDLANIEKELDTILNFFYKTHKMLYNNFVFKDLPVDFSEETFKLHLTLQFLVENGVVSKDTPYKTAVYDIPDIIKPYASEIGLLNVKPKETSND